MTTKDKQGEVSPSPAIIAAEEIALTWQYLDDETRPAMDLFLAGVRWLAERCEEMATVGFALTESDKDELVVPLDKIKELVGE